MASESKTDLERINFTAEPSLRSAIRKWRFQQEIETEGEAIRRLLKAGLQTVSNDQTVAA